VGDSASLPEIITQLLSLPREAGTPGADAARAIVNGHLSTLGYEVRLQRFTFAPASLNAFPVFGAGLGGLALAALPALLSQRLPVWSGLAVWVVGLVGLALVAAGIGLGWVTLDQGLREDANMVATRAGSSPRRWIVAHLDSKAQGHSMAGRLVAVWTVMVAIGVYTVLALLRLGGTVAMGWLAGGTGLALLAGFLASRGRLRGTSPGARDNASGIVAALAAAADCRDPNTGILITGAEEFGLVGARIFARLTPNLHELEFVNLDTLDEEGKLYVVSHDARGEQLGRQLEGRLGRLGLPVQHRRLLWGIFVDSAPLARAHAASVTLGRLTWATLRRIHTSADTGDDLSYRTAEQVGRAIVSSN
jgi:Peptidase family M28